MENKSPEPFPDVGVISEKTGLSESKVHRNGVDVEEGGSASTESNVQLGNVEDNEYNSAGDVNMEAAISADDVMRAGGFGARDDIGSMLPVASDSTDFEAMILNAKDYEGPQTEQRRPGLGWTDKAEDENPSSVHP